MLIQTLDLVASDGPPRVVEKIRTRFDKLHDDVPYSVCSECTYKAEFHFFATEEIGAYDYSTPAPVRFAPHEPSSIMQFPVQYYSYTHPIMYI